jgi:hypothetical protein
MQELCDASDDDESRDRALSAGFRTPDPARRSCQIVIYLLFWAVSSVGSEHLPYKQRVGGSNPSLPTRARVAELADAPDSKSGGLQNPCGFDSRLLHIDQDLVLA